MNPSIYHGLLPETLAFGGLALWSWWEYRLSSASPKSTAAQSTPVSASISASFQPKQPQNQAEPHAPHGHGHHGTREWEREDEIDPEVGLSDGAEMRKLTQFLMFLATTARWLTSR